jgi:hypothetical protein
MRPRAGRRRAVRRPRTAGPEPRNSLMLSGGHDDALSRDLTDGSRARTSARPVVQMKTRARIGQDPLASAAAMTWPPCWRRWPVERDLLARGQHPTDGAAATDRRVRGLPCDRWIMGVSADVSVLWPGRMLRQLAASARFGSRQHGTPDCAFRRTRGGLELALRRQRCVRGSRAMTLPQLHLSDWRATRDTLPVSIARSWARSGSRPRHPVTIGGMSRYTWTFAVSRHVACTITG